jgi:hypothetical protein
MARRKEHKWKDGIEYKWCNQHGEYHPVSAFSRKTVAWDGLSSICKELMKVHNAKRNEGIHKVYALIVGEAVKVGITRLDRATLVSRYRTHNAKPVHLILLTQCGDEVESRKLERELHTVLKHRWIQGEWFHLYEQMHSQTKAEEYKTHLYRRNYK